MPRDRRQGVGLNLYEGRGCQPLGSSRAEFFPTRESQGANLVRTREGNSPDWIQIGEAFKKNDKSIRAIAKENGISDAAVRKEAKKRMWVRGAVDAPKCEPNCEPEIEARDSTLAPVVQAANAKPTELVKRGRNIILALMSELETETGNIHLLEELIEIDTADEKAPYRRRQALQKAVSLPVRAQAAKNLATALRTLADAAPGKKEQADDDAKNAGQGSDWQDDLETPARVN